MLCKHIWISHRIRSILSILSIFFVYTHGVKRKFYPHCIPKKNSGTFGAQVWANSGPDLHNVLDLLGGEGGVSGSEPGHPPWSGRRREEREEREVCVRAVEGGSIHALEEMRRGLNLLL